MVIEFIIIFAIIVLSQAVGFWLGIRAQKKKVTKDIKKVTSFPGKVLEKGKILKKETQSAIIKAMTPEEFEKERRQKFEEENY